MNRLDGSVNESLCAPLPREEKERRRDDAAQAAEGLVYNVARFDPTYAGDMSAAAAFATLAAYWQARIEWEHGVGC